MRFSPLVFCCLLFSSLLSPLSAKPAAADSGNVLFAGMHRIDVPSIMAAPYVSYRFPPLEKMPLSALLCGNMQDGLQNLPTCGNGNALFISRLDKLNVGNQHYQTADFFNDRLLEIAIDEKKLPRKQTGKQIASLNRNTIRTLVSDLIHISNEVKNPSIIRRGSRIVITN